jgi:hypothetical protein
MLNQDLPFASLAGTNSESLTVQYWQEDKLEYVNFVVDLKSPETNPPIVQTLDTCSYNVRDAAELTTLLNGDSSRRFKLGAILFELQIYEHTWGVRYGYIAETLFTTIDDMALGPWPDPIGDYLLDSTATAGCLRFAFRCECDALRQFARQVDVMCLETKARRKR